MKQQWKIRQWRASMSSRHCGVAERSVRKSKGRKVLGSGPGTASGT